MRYRFAMCLVLTIAVAGTVGAQTQGSLSGRVTTDGQALPGVTVAVNSSALQGERVAITNASGDYKFPFLPTGDYLVTFALDSFQTLEFGVAITLNQPRVLDAQMFTAALEQEIVVTGSYEMVSTAIQGSSTVTMETLEKLPVLRTITNATRLSAGTSDTGPRGPAYI